MKLIRLQAGFDVDGTGNAGSNGEEGGGGAAGNSSGGGSAKNIAYVQKSLMEHSSFYASNPIVLSGMVKLVEV